MADLQGYLAHLSMLFGLAPRYAIGSMLPDWSLTLEWQFYLAFPFLLPVLLKRPASMAAVAFAATLLIWPVSPYPEPSFLPLKLPVFLTGCLCYLQHRSGGMLYLFANTSYSAYLVHGFFIAFLGSWVLEASPTGTHSLDLVAMIVVVLVGTYLVSAGLFVGVERPLTTKGRELAKRFVVARQAKPAA